MEGITCIKTTNEEHKELINNFPDKEQTEALAEVLVDVIEKTTGYKFIFLVVEGKDGVIVKGQLTDSGSCCVLRGLMEGQMQSGRSLFDILLRSLGPQAFIDIATRELDHDRD